MHSTWWVIGKASHASQRRRAGTRARRQSRRPRQRGRVARDVRDPARPQRRERARRPAGSGARRVEHDEVGVDPPAGPSERSSRSTRSRRHSTSGRGAGVAHPVATARRSPSTASTDPDRGRPRRRGAPRRGPTPAYRSRTRSPGSAPSSARRGRRRSGRRRGGPARTRGPRRGTPPPTRGPRRARRRGRWHGASPGAHQHGVGRLVRVDRVDRSSAGPVGVEDAAVDDPLVGDEAVVDGHDRWDRCRRSPARPSASTANSTRVRQPQPPSSPGTGSHVDVDVEPRRAAWNCSRTTSALSCRWYARSSVLEVAAAAPPRTGIRARRLDPVRRGIEHLDRVAAQEPVAVPPSVMLTRTRSPGRACRTKTTRPSSRATQCPPWATGPTSTTASVPTRLAAVSAGPARADGADDGTVEVVVLRALGRPQLPRHARDHDARGEQQPGLEPQRALVVQDLLLPAAEDVLGDVDDDDVARVAACGGSARSR